ncbi:uncharacterized protein TNCV_3746731 [Trichonephila clavipes]|nr:uncharacterized protein TNCV_3746731 [Trichonephila clavipes]
MSEKSTITREQRLDGVGRHDFTRIYLFTNFRHIGNMFGSSLSTEINRSLLKYKGGQMLHPATAHTSVSYLPTPMSVTQDHAWLSSDLFSVWFGNSLNDHQARRRFVEWAQNEIAVVPDFHKRILFSDEAHFWLNGYVNKQNGRIWSEANPQVYVETTLHPEKLTVWCALWVGGIIGPYFFKNDEGHNVTVNGDRYRAMITNFFIPELNNPDVQELWFQQDGATCHTVRAPID